MTTKRIRCSCGRIYDPVKRPVCPDCGAPHVVAQAEVDPGDETNESLRERPRPVPATAISPRVIAIAAGTIALLILIVLLSRCGSKSPTPAPSPTPSAIPTTTPAASIAVSTPAPAPPTIPPTAPPFIPPPNAGLTTDLAAELAHAQPGATIKIAPGLYPGGLVVSRGVHLVGNGGVAIQGDGRECLSVRAPGVSVQGVQFICNGIGELPAISVAEGADLDLDGCRIQSATSVGVQLAAKASLKALGVTFSANNGVALRVQQGQAALTQCTFSESRVGLSTLAGANVNLKSCAFERNGASGEGGIMSINGEAASVTANDCHFTGNTSAIFVNERATFSVASSFFKENGDVSNTNAVYGLIAIRKGARAIVSNCSLEDNRQGLSATEGGRLEIESCTFNGNGLAENRQAAFATMPVSIAGEGSSAILHKVALRNSAQFAIFALAGGNVQLEEVEISGSTTAGVVVGQQNTAPARAVLKHVRLLQNATGLGIFAGSAATLDEVECRANENGVIAAERNTQLEMRNARLLENRDHGLLVYAEARATVSDAEFRNNARGVQVGVPRKNFGQALVSLEKCAFGGNRVFGAGALSLNQLNLSQCLFDGTDKTNIYKERAAIVQMDATPTPQPSASPGVSPDSSPAPEAIAQPSASPTPSRHPRPTPTRKRRPNESEPARILRDLFGPR